MSGEIDFDALAERALAPPAPAAPGGNVVPFPGGAQPDFGALADRVVGGGKASAQQNLLSAQGTNPDNAAKAMVLSKQIGIPAPAVEENLAQAQQTADLKKNVTTLEANPGLQAFVAGDAQAARLAHDDLDNMSMLETMVNSFRRGIPGLFQIGSGIGFSGNAQLLENIDVVEKQLAAGVAPSLIRGESDLMNARFMTKEQRGNMKVQLQRSLEGNVSSIAAAQATKAQYPAPPVADAVSKAKDFGQVFDAFLGDPVRFIASVGPESAVTSGPSLLAGFLIPGGIGLKAITAGAGSAATDYGASIIEALGKEGVDVSNTEALQAAAKDPALMRRVAGQAIAHAAVVGTMDATSGRLASSLVLPAKLSAKMAAAPITREIAGAVAQMPVQGAMGALGEAGGELAAGQPLDPGSIFAEFAGEAFSTPGEIAAIAHGQVAERIQAARDAQKTSPMLAELTNLSTASKVLQRDTTTFETFAQQLTEEGGQDLWVSPAALQQSGVAEALVAASPSVGAQIQDAIQTGADIRIPTSEFLGRMTKDGIAQALVDHVKTEPDGMSKVEADAYMKEHGEALNAEVEKVLAQQQGDGAFAASRNEVQADLVAKLNTAGRFTPDVNTAYATLMSNFFATQAGRLGVSPKELYQQYAPRIVAEPIAGPQLNQGAAASVGDTLLELGKNKALFQFPKSDAKDAVEIAKAKDAGLKVEAETVTQMDGTEKPTGIWNITTADGKHATMQQEGRDVWINVSGLKSGGGGSAIYDLAANYAHNNGLVFIGDPAGISRAAMVRRAENMLSSAVKYGTTDHLEPHPDQLKGNDTTPGLVWKAGDTAANIEALVNVTLGSNEKLAPQTQGVRYDAGTGKFTDSEGAVLEGIDVLKQLSDWGREASGAGAPGQATVRRNALLRALVQGEGARRSLLEQLHRLEGDAGAGTGRALEGSFYQDARGSYDPVSNTVALLKGADLSTFLHESGHFYLEVLSDLASRPDAPAAIRADMDQLLAWFGVTSTENVAGRTPLESWRLMTLDEQRQYHEQFARGFEAYLFEGKAPNPELQGLFQRFRSWMLSVYRSLTKLNVDLTDEVRGVMDRLIATEDHIRAAEAARGMGLMFKDETEAAKFGVDWANYQALGSEATADAIDSLNAAGVRDMKWLSNARSKRLKEMQKQAEALRAGIEWDTRAEVMSQPVYRAWQYLTGKDETGENSGKLSTQALREQYGSGPDAVWRKLSAQRMTSDTVGENPEIVAELFGFTSADEMVHAIAAATPPKQVIAAITDQRMLEQHGDLATPEGVQRATDQAIHNDVRARMVATELAALEKASNPREATGKMVRTKLKDGTTVTRVQTAATLPRAARQLASDLINRTKVRDILPGQFSSAEGRAARAAEKALKAGDLTEAAAQKRAQLINGYANTAAHDAKAYVDKQLDYLHGFEKVRKTIDPDYQDQIDSILERFDLRRGQSLKSIDQRQNLAQWITEQEDLGIGVELPEKVRAEAFRQSYKDMTVEEFRGVVDSVRQIEHLGRLKAKLLTSKSNRDFAQTVDELVASIEKNGQGRQADTRSPTTRPGRWLQAVRNFGSAHIKAATWARIMDGGKDGGAMWESFVRVANERGDFETNRRAEATLALSEIMKPVLKGMTKKTFFPSVGRSFTRESVFTMALNTGNLGNLQRLLGGEGWTVDQLKLILDTLSAQDWQTVQKVWDYFETFRPEIAAKERRVSGVEPNWIEPTPVVTAHGTFNGGYYPIQFDPLASGFAEQHADAEAARQQLKGAYTAATTRRSFTKTRVEEVKGRPLLYTLSGLYGGVNDVIHDLAWHEWLIDTNRLLSPNAPLDAAMRAHYGPAAVRQFKTWSEAVATGDTPAQGAVDQLASVVKRGVGVAGLGFNVISAAMQPLGITQSIVRVGPKWIGRGVMDYIGAPISKTREVNEQSTFMANRARTRFRDLNELRNQVQGQSSVNEFVGRYAYWLMMRLQQAVDVPTWIGGYEKAIAEGNDEERAVALADQAVIDSQGGGQTKDLAAIERGTSTQKLFTVFYSFMNTALNVGVAQGMTNTSAAKTSVDMLLLYVVPAVLGALLKNAIIPGDSGDDDDLEKLARKLAGEQLSFLFGLFVGVRELGDLAKTMAGGDRGRDYGGPAGLRVFGDAGKAAQQVRQGEFDDAFRKAAINLTGDLLGLPSAQINRSITGAQALSEGKTSNPAALLFGYQEPH